jgi:hypothetical protein
MDILFLIVFFFLLIIMMLIGVIAVGFIWLGPVMPYIRAKWDKKDLVLLIGKDNKIRLIPVKYSSKVFTASSAPYTFLQRVPRSYRLGDVNVVLVDDGWGVVIDPDMNEALRVLAENGYVTYDQLRDAINKKKSLGTLGSDELDKIIDAIEIHAFKEIPIHNVLDYVGNVTGGQLKAYLDEEMAKFVEEYRKLGTGKEKSSNGLILVVLLLIIIGVGLTKILGFW